MANIILTWVPGGGTIVNQRALRIAKANGDTPNITTGFNPTNDLNVAANTTTAENLNTNTVYRFMVKSLCNEGEPFNNTNGVIEGIVFECLDSEDDVTINYNTAGLTKTATITIDLPNHTPIDGGSTITNYTDIKKVELSIYNAANNAVVKTAVEVTQANGTVIHSFTGLGASVTYTLRYVLIAELNGVPVRSDATGYLSAPCTVEFTTSAL